jgi:uncharacterized coiled-coil protein SlyX
MLVDADKVKQLIEDLRANLRGECTAAADLIESLSAQVAELQATLKERGLWYAGRESCILNARDAHQQRADRAEAQVAELRKDADSKQAKIDRLMLEFCPDEMTPEQIEDWGKHQMAAKESGGT